MKKGRGLACIVTCGSMISSTRTGKGMPAGAFGRVTSPWGYGTISRSFCGKRFLFTKIMMIARYFQINLLSPKSKKGNGLAVFGIADHRQKRGYAYADCADCGSPRKLACHASA